MRAPQLRADADGTEQRNEPVPAVELYQEPEPLRMWQWPPEKPPSLEQMERDMVLWARQEHEVKKKSFHEGRLAEYERAKGIFTNLVARDEKLID